MTGFDAIGKVKDELDRAGLTLKGGIYQFSKPVNKEDSEYIEINCLALSDEILQKANVNVNIYVKDIVVGTPDNGRLKELTDEIIGVFPISKPDENIHLFLNDTDIVTDIDNSQHYVNLRLRVIMLN